MTQKIVINVDFGGFRISKLAEQFIKMRGGNLANITRDDPLLVRAVEELGEKANGHLSKLKVVEIPDGIEWEITYYDGWETVEESHKSWG